MVIYHCSAYRALCRFLGTIWHVLFRFGDSYKSATNFTLGFKIIWHDKFVSLINPSGKYPLYKPYLSHHLSIYHNGWR